MEQSWNFYSTYGVIGCVFKDKKKVDAKQYVKIVSFYMKAKSAL